MQVGGQLTVGDRQLVRAVRAGPVRRQGQVGRPAAAGAREPRDSSEQNEVVPGTSSNEMTWRTQESSAAASAVPATGSAVIISRAPQSVSWLAISAAVPAQHSGDGTPPAARMECTAST